MWREDMVPPPLVMTALIYAGSLALLACGITLIYMCTRTFNFAQASMATWGFYVVFTGMMLSGWKASPYYFWPLAFLLGALLGAICYSTINRPLLRRKASEITLMMSTLGYDIILFAVVNIYSDYLLYVHRPLFDPEYTGMSMFDITVLGVAPLASVVSPLLAIGAITALHLFLTKTKFGIALRATVENPDLAGMVGISSDKVYLASWLIGGGLATLGGAVMCMTRPGQPIMGALVIVSMFASSILGGLYSVYGAILGGMVIGFVEIVGTYLLSLWLGVWMLAYAVVLPLVVMAITLLTFPRGLAGLPWGRLVAKISRFLASVRGGESGREAA